METDLSRRGFLRLTGGVALSVPLLTALGVPEAHSVLVHPNPDSALADLYPQPLHNIDGAEVLMNWRVAPLRETVYMMIEGVTVSSQGSHRWVAMGGEGIAVPAGGAVALIVTSDGWSQVRRVRM